MAVRWPNSMSPTPANALPMSENRTVVLAMTAGVIAVPGARGLACLMIAIADSVSSMGRSGTRGAALGRSRLFGLWTLYRHLRGREGIGRPATEIDDWLAAHNRLAR
jgi:hypothetical protein